MHLMTNMIPHIHRRLRVYVAVNVFLMHVASRTGNIFIKNKRMLWMFLSKIIYDVIENEQSHWLETKF